MNRPSPTFHSAIFLLDLCTIKSSNLLHSVFLCPFQYSADTKHFLVYTVSAICQSCAPLSRQNITSKNVCAYIEGLLLLLSCLYTVHKKNTSNILYVFFICCVQIPPARSYCNKNSMRLCWGGTSVRAAFPRAHVISDTSWDHNPIRQMESCLRSRERLPPLPVNTGSSWI